MTVGIYVGNGRKAFAIADSRVTMGQRQSDLVQKLTIYSGDHIHGMFFGAGSGMVLHAAANCLQANSKSAKSVRDLAECIRSNWDKSVEDMVTQFCDSQRRNLEAAAHIYADDTTKKEYILRESQKALQAVQESERENMSHLVLVGYDKASRTIQAQSIHRFNSESYDDFQLPIGSGADGAHLLITMERQGLDMSTFSGSELLLMLSTGYAGANLNTGVGGQSSIAQLDETGAYMLPEDRATLVQNIGAIYAARILPYGNARLAMETILTPEQDMDLLAKRISEQSSIDIQLLRTLGLDARKILTLANKRRHRATPRALS